MKNDVGGPTGPARRVIRASAICAVLIGTWGSGAPLPAQEAGGPHQEEQLEADLERIRAATKAFHDLTAAHAAGYPTEVPGCLENPPEGGMGHHYVHPELMDDRLDLERPEILVYAPTGEGDLKLAGVEYVVPFRHWPPDAEAAPRILGHELKPSEGLQIWYLHVWVWEENPTGLFADWNPAVRCSP